MVNKFPYEQRINSGNHRGLCRGKNTTIDASQNNDGGHQCGQGVQKDLQETLIVLGTLNSLITALFRNNPTDNHQANANQNAWNKARLEHITHRGAGSNAVDHKGDRRGDDDANRTSCGSQTSGKSPVIAPLFHLWQHDGAHGGHSSRAGARDGRKKHTADDGSHAQATGKLTHRGVGKIDDTSGDTAQSHQIARQHEEGNGDQRKGVQTSKRFLGHHHRANVAGQADGQRCGHAQSDADRHTQHDQHKKHAKQKQNVHSAAPPSTVFLPIRLLIVVSIRRMLMSTIPTGMEA